MEKEMKNQMEQELHMIQQMEANKEKKPHHVHIKIDVD